MRFIILIATWCVAASALAQRLSPLAEKPDWNELDAFQGTITREDFVRELGTIFAPGDAAAGLIEVTDEEAVIRTTLQPPEFFHLRFAPDAQSAKPVPRYWRPPAELGAPPEDKPLAGAKIALDPGHIGGRWARMEERFLQYGESKPIVEGDMTLKVAELLAPMLRALGADVTVVRRDTAPTTATRPADLRKLAREQLALHGVANPRETYDPLQIVDPTRAQTVQWQSEILFYRVSEIRHRAEIVNARVKPDLVVCLHFNAESWGDDPGRPVFVPRNHLHLLVNGCYSAGELRNDDVRFDMLRKLLNGSSAVELRASSAVARAMAAATGLPAYTYTTDNAIPAGASGYLWARNLLANRLYRAPVIFLEPYVMNSETVWKRVQLGAYSGLIEIDGTPRKNIFAEYADAVAEGVRAFFTGER
jgi:N-acetylmuramoyl-L-alanine amidase